MQEKIYFGACILAKGVLSYLSCKSSGCGAVGSALDWGSRGREFKSRHSDQLLRVKVERFWLLIVFIATFHLVSCQPLDFSVPRFLTLF